MLAFGLWLHRLGFSTLIQIFRLLAITVVTSFAADIRKWILLGLVVIFSLARIVVGSIEQTAEKYHIPKTFIGLILLPLVVSTKPLVAHGLVLMLA